MKIKAFTILEMIVNMAVMGIIVSMVYVIYIAFSRNIDAYATISAQDFEIQAFQSMLREDFFFSEEVLAFNDESFTAEFYNGDRVRYFKNNNFLYRESDVSVDSIPSMNSIGYVYMGDSNAAERLVKSVTITTDLLEAPVKLFASKDYFSNTEIFE